MVFAGVGHVIAALAIGVALFGAPAAPDPPDCTIPSGVQRLEFSAAKYPHIRAHYRRAVRKHYPRVLVLRREGADQRRDKLLRGFPTKPGFDRDEYPPAVGRRVVRADVEYVASSENRSHGATMGAELRKGKYCSGTRFRYVFL